MIQHSRCKLDRRPWLVTIGLSLYEATRTDWLIFCSLCYTPPVPREEPKQSASTASRKRKDPEPQQ